MMIGLGFLASLAWFIGTALGVSAWRSGGGWPRVVLTLWWLALCSALAVVIHHLGFIDAFRTDGIFRSAFAAPALGLANVVIAAMLLATQRRE
jgi:hypothetical protein